LLIIFGKLFKHLSICISKGLSIEI